jgi:hypothetical protein
MMTAVALLSCEGRRWGDRDDNDGEEEVVEVEVDDNEETVVASGGGGRRKGGFEESSRRRARPKAPSGRLVSVSTKSTFPRGGNDDGGGNVVLQRQAVR